MRLISGPCQHESLQHSLTIAKHCKEICDEYGFEYVFKASYDKANRSSSGSKRGVGLKTTMNDFWALKADVKDLKILTDVHDTNQVETISLEYNDCVDILQIPAFLCRQTDLLTTVCRTGKIVNIKKGQFLAPWDMRGILSKVEDARTEVWVTDRGTSFGYNNLVVDFTGIRWMLDNLDRKIIMDCTHAVQRPGGNGTSSGGNRDYAPYIARAAAAIGVQDFFLEVHDDPDNAPSDGPNMIRLEDFEKTIKSLYNIIKAISNE